MIRFPLRRPCSYAIVSIRDIPILEMGDNEIMMYNRNLEIFIKAAEYGNLTKAAKTLYISQPAVSNALSKLEEELEVKLFFRDKRNGMVLTGAGEKILSLAKQMADIDNRISQVAYKEKHFIGGRLRIASLVSLTSTIISRTLKQYQTQFPDVLVEIREGTPKDLVRMVEDHEVDFAVSCAPFWKFDSFSLIHDHMVALLPHGQTAEEVNLNADSGTLIINRPAYETILEYLPRKNSFRSDKVLLVQTPEAAIHMVNDGIGTGIVSEYTLRSLIGDVPFSPVSPLISFDIGFFAHDLQDLTPVAAEFVRIMKDLHAPQHTDPAV